VSIAGARPTRVDVQQLTGAKAKGMIALQFAVSAVLAGWTIGDAKNPLLVLLGLATLGVVSVVMVRGRGERMPLGASMVILAGGPVMALMLFEGTSPGYTQWFIGSATLTLFYLSLRGRILLSWVGFGLLSAVIIAIDLAVFNEFMPAVDALGRQSAVLLVGTLFSFGLRRTGDRLEQLTAQTTARISTEAANRAAANERKRRLAQLEEFAAPLLRRLVDGETLTTDDRREFAVAEAALRDGVRGAKLARADVITAARSARLRGVEVVLLDDSGDAVLGESELERASAAIVEVLSSSLDGRVTARILPSGREILATVVADGTEYVKREVPRAPAEFTAGALENEI